jgi:hypothetical protein
LRLEDRRQRQPMRRRSSNNVLESLVGKASRPLLGPACGVVPIIHPETSSLLFFCFQMSNNDHIHRSYGWPSRNRVFRVLRVSVIASCRFYHQSVIAHNVVQTFKCLLQRSRTHGGRTLGQLRLLYDNPGASLVTLRGNDSVLERSDPEVLQ